MFSKKFDVKQLVYVELFTNFILSLPLLFIFGDFHLDLHWKFITGVVYLAVIATSLVFFLQMRYQKDTTATKAAIIYCLEPIFASGIAYLTIGETFTTTGLVGAAIIITRILFT